jgi:hypothetical protein
MTQGRRSACRDNEMTQSSRRFSLPWSFDRISEEPGSGPNTGIGAPRPDARAGQVDGRVAVGKAQHPLRLPQIHDRRMARAAAQVRPRPACLFPATPAGCQRRQTGCPSVGGLGPEGWSPTWHLLPAALAPAGTATAGRPSTGSAWGLASQTGLAAANALPARGGSQDQLPEIAALGCQN